MRDNIEFQTIIMLLKQNASYKKNSTIAIAKGLYKIKKNKSNLFKVLLISKLKRNA